MVEKIETDRTTADVTQQYVDFAYPLGFKDLAETVRQGFREGFDPSQIGPLIWPEGRPGGRLRILSAGCGTNQAAMLAYANPDCDIVGIDLSETSLSHETYLRDKHNLENLFLQRLDLRRAGDLGQKFDLIVCTGVLHHLSSPIEGLRALASVLTPNGVLGGMVYGAGSRLGIYPLQDAFRRLGIERTVEGAKFVRSVVEGLSDSHPAKTYAKTTRDLNDDVGFVDTFLHPQDRAYFIPELMNLIAESGLTFQSWQDNVWYHLDAFESLFGSNLELKERLAGLPDIEQWAILEALTLAIGTHSFLLTTSSRQRSDYEVSFAGESWLNYKPVPHTYCAIKDRKQGRMTIVRQGKSVTLGAAETFFYDSSNGRTTISQMLEHPNVIRNSIEMRIARAKTFFARMWRLGDMFFPR